MYTNIKFRAFLGKILEGWGFVADTFTSVGTLGERFFLGINDRDFLGGGGGGFGFTGGLVGMKGNESVPVLRFPFWVLSSAYPMR